VIFRGKLGFEDAFFEAIYSVEAAQHFHSFALFCSEANRVLKETGMISITTYFLKKESFRNKVGKIIPPTVEGTDKIISIDQAKECLERVGFSDVNIESIGHKVFPGFALWQKQIIQLMQPVCVPKAKIKWSNYYNIDSDEHHPWFEVFENGWLDYYIITSAKPRMSHS
jgi:cyclopropane fatty-acyl-phospholipid synthase-like methyltransferase